MAYPSQYELVVEVFDQQEHSMVHNISVQMCTCGSFSEANCHKRHVSKSVGAGGTVEIMFAAMLLLLGTSARAVQRQNNMLLQCDVDWRCDTVCLMSLLLLLLAVSSV